MDSLDCGTVDQWTFIAFISIFWFLEKAEMSFTFYSSDIAGIFLDVDTIYYRSLQSLKFSCFTRHFDQGLVSIEHFSD